MTEGVTPYNTDAAKKTQVADMFDNIAHRYDLVNQLLSFGIHKGWRKKAVGMLEKDHPRLILDIATGTGDFAIEALRLKPDKVIGVDISEGMMKMGREKLLKMGLSNRIELRSGDSENLPFADNTFDALTVGFGVRNFENLEKGLAGMLRVLKPDAQAVILEFSKPRIFPVKQIYSFYFKRVCPFIGKVFSRDNRAYTYLNESVTAFPDGEDFLNIMRRLGYDQCTRTSLTFGIATIYTGKK
ncbi:MAG TPA: bifunctional demethylmenaquinone methyltransferase/2-methoxy-6-polyprenyl-1,4-benzoquinol methylase UbiE [Bacteroidia bacterium]|jgi:demethylmenaquinone methyltransferase/2-methoxy-6-polyprenyl-1,4-benzoquinol methylase|nr:bifunctional demethylmenaquinone methyltransferase/2-methoxy-6-polyprenyl-1,4-benzoquinol methylase UbiE [Bacteroidia bacterium]